jgi:predicted MFS family arabinose efflux permease
LADTARAGVTFGWSQRPIRLLMVASALETGFLFWAFYAWQPYLLELLDRDAVWVAGVVASAIALATICGNQIVDFASRYCGKRTTLMLWAAAVQSAAAIAIGLTSSFWIAVFALLVMFGAIGVLSPVRQAYLQQLIPSEQRATVTSFDSMVGGVGGVAGQLGLGALGEARSVRAAFLVGGLATTAVLPLFAGVRRIGGRADLIVGRKAGADSPCAGSGIPTVSTVDTQPLREVEQVVPVPGA